MKQVNDVFGESHKELEVYHPELDAIQALQRSYHPWQLSCQAVPDLLDNTALAVQVIFNQFDFVLLFNDSELNVVFQNWVHKEDYVDLAALCTVEEKWDGQEMQ